MPRRLINVSIEKLHNLEALPDDGSTIRGASAGWTRAVAIFDG